MPHSNQPTQSPAGQLTNHLTIGEAAKKIHVSIKTLRRWHAEGLIHALRNSLNQRLFDPDELERVKNTRSLLTHTQSEAQFLTISEAAQLLHLSVKTIRRWDKAGRIESFRNTRNQRVFTKEAIIHAKVIQENQMRIPLYNRTYNQQLPHFNLSLPGLAPFAAASMIVLVLTALIRPMPVSPVPSKVNFSGPNNLIVGATASTVTNSDIELPPLTTKQLQLASAAHDLAATTALHNHTANVPVDAPPTSSNLLEVSNNNVEYINDNELNKILNNITNNQPANITMPNRPTYALTATQLPIESPISDIPVRGQMVAIIIPLTDSSPSLTDRLYSPDSFTSLHPSLPPTNLDPNGNVIPPNSAPVPTPPLIKNSEITPSQSVNLISTPTGATQQGHHALPAHQTSVRVPVSGLNPSSVILITFEADYAPATKYWVTQDSNSFTLHLDRPVLQDIPFSWAIPDQYMH